ncbi:MAG TPA: excinuclease ABC subunit UvrC [Acidimicrobiales bacterium]|jgi:excinuclease ABC subunit C|nr:excinuclease ABC subunit UvrC [Acidimicrobiales bacterium]
MVVTRPAPGSIPDGPGSYQFVDGDGRVLYVGKAKSIRQRLSSYFQDPSALGPRTAQMVQQADHVEWMVVGSESEALLLEHNLIQQFQPRYNVRLKDDKSYPWLAITLDEQWPRPAVVRGRKRSGVRYFGPYPNVYAIRDTLDLLLRSFPIRSCSNNKFDRHERLGRPCLLYHIERCAGPCVGAVEPEDYAEMVDAFMSILSGDTGALERQLEAGMREAAASLAFERASILRDKLDAVRKADAVRQMELARPEDLDVIGIAEDELEAAIQVFHVRSGKVVGRLALFMDKVEDLTPGQLVERILVDVYADAPSGVPRQVLVPTMPEDAEAVSEYLAERRGGPVALRVPVRGPKRSLQETVARNADEAFLRHRLQRTSDHNSRARALESLQRELGLPDAPLRIECYDMSHLQGTDYVGSMVVFEDGLAKKSDYRHYKVSSVPGNDDYAAMEEVLTRRLTALLAEDENRVADPAGPPSPNRDKQDRDEQDRDGRPATPRHRFAYPPQLLLLDGGKGQLAVGVRVLERLGLTDRVPIASLAKSFEEVYLPGREEPLRLPRQSEALYLLQRLRDEAHRFAISYHRKLRGKRMTAGVLDGIPGLGPKRRARLLSEFGGIGSLRKATVEEIRARSWLPDQVADTVHQRLHRPMSPSGPGAGRARVER